MNSLTANLRAARLESRKNHERLMAAIEGERFFEDDDLSDMYQDGLEYWRAKLGADTAAH